MELPKLPQNLKLILFALRDNETSADYGFTDEWIAKALKVKPNQLDEIIGREAEYDEITAFVEMMNQK